MPTPTYDDVPSTTEEIKEAYNEKALLYALFEPVAEYLGLRRVRRRLLSRASGNVLEVAVGTGLNLPYYPEGCHVTAVDISEAMMKRAQERAEKCGLDVDFHVMDAEALGFPDDHFDTVVSTMTVCTFPHPIVALGEMQRVCRPGQQILLMEHGRSSVSWIARWQDRRATQHAQQLGCHWNREPLELAREAGLDVLEAKHHFFGVFHEIVGRSASPPLSS